MLTKQNKSIKILVSDLIELKIKAPIKDTTYQRDITIKYILYLNNKVSKYRKK